MDIVHNNHKKISRCKEQTLRATEGARGPCLLRTGSQTPGKSVLSRFLRDLLHILQIQFATKKWFLKEYHCSLVQLRLSPLPTAWHAGQNTHKNSLEKFTSFPKMWKSLSNYVKQPGIPVSLVTTQISLKAPWKIPLENVLGSGWGWGSDGECLPGAHEALSSIPSTS